jgi:membrane protein DedA with SNARE-associated domain
MEEHFIRPFIEYFHHHQTLGIGFAFIIALIESLPILGTLVPGSITMTAIGALVGAGILPPWETLLGSFLGAMLGDCLGFWLGWRYQDKIRSVWPFNKISRYLTYAENFFAKHGGKSLIIGRFIGPTRAAMPLVAGMLRYTWKQFIPVAMLASLSWSLVYMLPGVALGALATEVSHAVMTKFLLGGLITIVILWLIFWVLQYFFRQMSRAINHQIQAWWNWLNRFSHYGPGWLVRLIRNPEHPHDYRQLKLFLLFLFLALLFLLVWFSVIHHCCLIRLNVPLFNLIQSFRKPSWDPFWVILTTLGTPEALLITSVLAGVALCWYRQYRSGVHLILVGIVTAGAIEVVKKIYFFPRPGGLAWVNPSSSFPSGHTGMAVAVLGFLAFLTIQIAGNHWRKWIYTLTAVLILLISVSRLFLGQHWVTDIIGAWALGLSVLLLVTISYRRTRSNPNRPKMKSLQWIVILLISTMLPWLASGFLSFSKTLRDSRRAWPVTNLSFQQWWTAPTEWAPIYRIDRFGHIVEPFNIQCAAEVDKIQSFLLSRGWEQKILQPKIYITLQRFTSHLPEFNTPLLARLYQDNPPEMFFIKHLPDSSDILELSLWQSRVKFSDSNLPLWVGILTYHTPPSKILRSSEHYIHFQTSMALINPPPESSVNFQMQHIPTENQPAAIRKLQWDGNILILIIL